ncbi:MAG: hypothetical protein KDD50_08670, partial [Bdellovibrionales bacterium]|nr:hypothetical protein [Bdellovibrionales bacterium]
MNGNNSLGLSSLDKIIVLISSLIAGVFGYLLINEHIVMDYFLPKKVGIVSIGEVYQTQNDVRRKLKKSISWYKLNQEEIVFEGDSVFSGENSEVVVQLASGIKVNLGSNSLVVLKKQNDNFILDLQVGEVSAEASNEGRLSLLQQGDVAEIDFTQNSKLSLVKSKAGDISVSSIAGRALVRTQADSQRIEKNIGVSIDKTLKLEKKTFPIRMVEPTAGAIIWKSFMEHIVFSWEYQGLKKTDYTLEFAKDRQFKQIFYSQTTPENRIIAKEFPMDETFFWKVQTKDESGLVVESKVRKLTVRSAEPVKLIYPLHQGQIQISDNKDKISIPLEWMGKSLNTKYVFNMATDVSFKKLLVNEQVNKAFVRKNLGEGIYYWRVRVLAQKVNTAWSETRSFSIVSHREIVQEDEPKEEKEEKQEEVVEEKEQKEKIVDFKMKAKSEDYLLDFDQTLSSRDPASVKKAILNPPKIVWPKQTGAITYRVQITEGDSFEKPFLDKFMSSNSLEWTPESSGMHYWRVKAINDKKEEITKWSKTQKINIKLPPISYPKLNKLTKSVDSPKGLNADHKYKLKWKDVPMASYYLTEISQDATFAKKKQFVSKGSSVLIPTRSGEYFVRGYVLNDQKRKVSSAAETLKIKLETKLKLETPKLDLPDNQMSIVTFGNNFEPVLFSWSKIKNSKIYRLQLAKTKDFKVLILDSEVSENSYLLTEKKGKGKIYWRVRAEYQSSTSSWSKIR